MKQTKSLDDDKTESLHAPSVQIIFPQLPKSFPAAFPKTFHEVSLQRHSISAQGKAAKDSETSRGKISKQSLFVSSKKDHLETERRRFYLQKRFTPPKSQYSCRH